MILPRIDLRDLPLEERLVRLHVARLALLVPPELTCRRGEGIAQRCGHGRIGVFLARAVRLTADHQRAARQAELDMDVAGRAAAMLLARRLDSDAAADQPRIDLLELQHLLADRRLDPFG